MSRPLDTPPAIFQAWFSGFTAAMTATDPDGVASLFLPHGWFRDVLTLTWDFRALRGPTKISAYLKDHLPLLTLSNFQPDADPFLLPHFVPESNQGTIEAAFTYETPIAYGRGYVQLAKTAPERGWSALLVCMTLTDLKGHEEPRDPIDWESEAQGRPYGELVAERHGRNERDPHVLIIGAGQTGLQVAARCDRLGIPTLLIEQSERIGDIWRHRYDSLALHTPKMHHFFLYQPFPESWPIFTPRDRLADWLETYAINQELTVWPKSKLARQPIWDHTSQRWNVTVNRGGTPMQIRPAHIVVSTGVLGAPQHPDIADRHLFKGITMHGCQYKNAYPFKDKDVVVIGAGNSSIDICQDSVYAGAKSVTMVQRSSTCVTARSNVVKNMGKNWPSGEPSDVGDFRFGSTPLGMLREHMIAHQEDTWAADRELHAKLRKGGMQLHIGSEGQGQFLMVFERAGGYWLDKGGADLIASGDIKIKQGVAPKAYTSDGLIFTDGSKLKADVVVAATGYKYMRETSVALLGADVIDRTGQVWGLDAEGELSGTYRPSGHPGLWFAAGDFFNGRYMSKHLALQIKARQLGYINDGQRASL
ncbi:FAD/NAD(P)-binding domain-containing protein [Irpex rosettiformis]|uniref:FAD/NAD(P)-binding domain-containing protein n=1 Tax=Irpex rosettiformis TaxID=378272 RepID=A0ACB8TYF7_9APHY|nr:FAD/NAD(P)-binding domain-containing protein [Irpex rosettiformis]